MKWNSLARLFSVHTPEVVTVLLLSLDDDSTEILGQQVGSWDVPPGVFHKQGMFNASHDRAHSASTPHGSQSIDFAIQTRPNSNEMEFSRSPNLCTDASSGRHCRNQVRSFLPSHSRILINRLRSSIVIFIPYSTLPKPGEGGRISTRGRTEP